MDAGKPQAGGAGRVAVGIPFGQVASEARNAVVGATRQRQAAEPVLRDVWSKPADNPLVPAALALGETVRRRRAPAVAWATAFATVAAFTAVLLGWLTLPEDAFVPEETGGPVGWQSIRRGEAGGYSPALAAAADSGREARNAGLALPPVPIEPWGTADPTDRTPALAYALGVPRSRNPAPPNEPLAIAGEPTGVLAAEAPAIRLVAGAKERRTRSFGADRPRRRVPPAIGRRLGAPLLSIGRRQRQRRRCHRDGIHVRSRLSDPQCRPRRQPRARKGSRVVSKGCRTRRSPGEDANRSAPRRTASRRRARRPAGAGDSRKGDDRIRVVGKRLSAGSER